MWDHQTNSINDLKSFADRQIRWSTVFFKTGEIANGVDKTGVDSKKAL